MNITTFDPSKPYHTREGGAAERVCDLDNPKYPHGYKFTKKSGEQTVSGFTANGRYSSDDFDHPWDLINDCTIIQATAFANIHANGVVKTWPDQATADAWAGALGGRIACVEVNFDIPAPTV